MKKVKKQVEKLVKKGAPMNPNLVRMTKGANPKLKAGVHPSDVESYKEQGWAVDDRKG
jgi:hypothetical protein